MSEALAVQEPTALAIASVRPIVAISREDFPAAQAKLIAVLEQKRDEQVAIADDLRENLAIAKKNKWRHSGLARALRNAERTQDYYNNASLAVRDGYMLVPNLECDVYAVRQDPDDQMVPPREESTWGLPNTPGVPTARALPAGVGEYVSDTPAGFRGTEKVEGEKDVRYFQPTSTQAPEAPMVLARPVLLEAAQAAMARKVFDEIGIVGATRSSKRADPMLVGRILHPVTAGKMMTFFLAWWLDPRSL